MLTLQAPYPLLQTTTILPDPKFSDSEGLMIVVTRKLAMDGTKYTYIKNKGRRKLKLVLPADAEQGPGASGIHPVLFRIPDPSNGLQRAGLGGRLRRESVRVRYGGVRRAGD